MSTDQDYIDLQRELARRRQKVLPCQKCETLSYDELSNMYAFSLTTPNAAKDAGWRDFDDCAGMYRLCLDCEAKPETTYAWIADIPLSEFKAWMDDHPEAFCLDELRVLLPAQEEDKGGFRFL